MSFDRSPRHAAPTADAPAVRPELAVSGRIAVLQEFGCFLVDEYQLSWTIVPGVRPSPPTPVLRVESATARVDIGADYDERRGGWFYT